MCQILLGQSLECLPEAVVIAATLTLQASARPVCWRAMTVLHPQRSLVNGTSSTGSELRVLDSGFRI